MKKKTHFYHKEPQLWMCIRLMFDSTCNWHGFYYTGHSFWSQWNLILFSVCPQNVLNVISLISRLSFRKTASFNLVVFPNVDDAKAIHKMDHRERAADTQTAHFWLKNAAPRQIKNTTRKLQSKLSHSLEQLIASSKKCLSQPSFNNHAWAIFFFEIGSRWNYIPLLLVGDWDL